MSFVFPVLLGGLTLIGVPILLHLIMRQKPKHLFFPAFRFLLQRHRTNQRKLQLRHLLLLALRLLLVAGVCLALARPKLFSSRLNLSGERPIAAVLVFDTSFSMGYVSGGKDRLETARQRALELLAELPEGSRVAVLDTAEPGGEWLPTLSLARDRIGDLKLRPANSPVTTRLAEAYRLLADLDQETESGDDALPKFLYIFSDRTQDSWDQSRVKDLQQLRDRLATEAHAVLVDVGVDKPVDLALVAVEMPRQVVPTDDTAQLKVTVRSIGERVDTEVVCRIDGKAAEHKLIKLDAGQSQVVVFERRDLPAGFHQAEITLATNDALPFNNAQFATFEVRGGRRVLALVDDPNDAAAWRTVFDVSKEFRCEVRTVAEARRLSPTEDLAKYQAVCLLNVASPEHDLWQKLKSYVDKGGGLAIAPGSDMDLKAYNGDPIARELLPGRLIKVVQAEKKKDEKEARASWKEATYQHPVMAPFKDWSTDPNIDFLQFPPAAFRYWEVEPSPKPDSYVIVSYDDKESRPALIERNFDPKAKVRGRVLLYTTPLDARHLGMTLDRAHPNKEPRWNDYLTTSFFQVVVYVTTNYLAGSAESMNFNYLSGQTVTVSLPATPRSPTYTLQGPGINAAESVVPRAEGQGELSLTQPVMPGNYTLRGAEGDWRTQFSVNMPPEESQLSRVPPEQIEQLLGPKCILPVGQGANFREVLQGHWSQPIELFPWIMMLVLLALAVENLLANKFYRRETRENLEAAAPAPTTQA